MLDYQRQKKIDELLSAANALNSAAEVNTRTGNWRQGKVEQTRQQAQALLDEAARLQSQLGTIPSMSGVMSPLRRRAFSQCRRVSSSPRRGMQESRLPVRDPRTGRFMSIRYY